MEELAVFVTLSDNVMDSRGVMDHVYVNHVLDFVPTLDAVPSEEKVGAVAVETVRSGVGVNDKLTLSVTECETDVERSSVPESLGERDSENVRVSDVDSVNVPRVGSIVGLTESDAESERSSVKDDDAEWSSVTDLEMVFDMEDDSSPVMDSDVDFEIETEADSSRVGDFVHVRVDVLGGETVGVMVGVWEMELVASSVGDLLSETVTVIDWSGEMESVPLVMDCETERELSRVPVSVFLVLV